MGDLTTFRYGTDVEHVMTEKSPKVGDVMRRNGDEWVVVEIKEGEDGKSTVVLRPAGS